MNKSSSWLTTQLVRDLEKTIVPKSRTVATTLRGLTKFTAGAMLLGLALGAAGAEKVVNVATPVWGTKITATSAFSDTYAASKAADGSFAQGNSWVSMDNAPLPQTLTLTFAEPFNLTLARIHQPQVMGSFYHTKDFRVEGSADGTTFQTIATGTLADDSNAEWTHPLSNSVLRAVRIVILSSYTAVQTCGLGEVELMASLPEDRKPPFASASPAINWYDCATLVADGKITLEGKGWTNGESFYDRLPAKASGVVTPDVWRLSHDSAGLGFRFETDATMLHVRWRHTSATLAMPHMPATGVSGVDFYVKAADGRWLFQPGQSGADTASIFRLNVGRKACVLNLPLYNGVQSIEFGVAEGQTFSKIQEQRPKPIVVYGTSIAQGGCASRPGMAWTSIVGRHLDVPVINLGFSGSGQMEMAMADLLAELDPSVYVLDCLPNMSPAMVSERMAPFVRKLRSVHPTTPIVLVEAAQFQRGLRPIYEKLQRAGDSNLHFASGIDAPGDDGEGTVDGVHPTDLGMMRQAMGMEKALRPILTTTTVPRKGE